MLKEGHPQAVVSITGAAEPPARTASAFRDPVTWVIAVCVLGAYLTLSLSRLLLLIPSSWDLAIYTEYVKQLAGLHAPIVDVRGPGFNLLGDHFQVIVALIAPLFRAFPTPATLLVVQALLTALSVFPVTTAAMTLLGRGEGRAVGFAYGFSWGLQQMISFDFHEIAFAVPLLAFSLSALVRGRTRAAVWWALPLVFVKEDQGFTVAAIGLLMAMSGIFSRGGDRPGRLRLIRGSRGGGMFLIVWGMAWSLLAITVIIPHFNAAHHYMYWNLGGVAGSGSTPLSATGLVAQAFHAWPVKLQTVVVLLLPTALIALGSPVALLVLPSLALRFTVTHSSYWGTRWHYNATLMPILFIAAIEVIVRWRAALLVAAESPATAVSAEATAPPPTAPSPASGASSPARALTDMWRWTRLGATRHGAAMMAAIAVPLAFQFPLRSIWHSSTYQSSPHVAAANAAMAQIPDGVTVQATIGMLAPLAARTDTFSIGDPGNPPTQYIIFDGLESGYTPAPANVPAFIKQLYPTDSYVPVFVSDQVYVFRRD
jgi:uncharacterized membrane protein